MDCENDLTLGPFYDADGDEIIPCTTEATDKAIEECMGSYHVVAYGAAWNRGNVSITNRLMTEYIQADWDRMSEDLPSKGFLLAYQSSQKAVGRLAEEILCAQLFAERMFADGPPASIVPIQEAIGGGLLSSHAGGIRCDDLLVITQSGQKYIGEVKGSFTGTSYLLRSLPKAVGQLRSTLAVNPDVRGAVLVLVAFREKRAVLVVSERADLESRRVAEWPDVVRRLLAAA